MADDQTQTVDPNDQQAALVQQLLRQTLTGQSMQPTPEPPHSGDNRTWGSLLGQALVGGAGPGSTDAQNEQAGLRALQQVGLGMMSGSDYSQQRHSLGSIIANAVGGAQESNYAQIAGQQEYQKTQQEMQLARIKEAVPLLTLQQNLARLKAATGMPNPLATTPTTIAAAGTGGIGAVGSDTGPVNAAGDSATRKAAEGGPPAPGTPAAAVAQQVHDFWVSKGFSEPVVAGIMAGGPGSESNFDPTASGDKGTSIGLYQHHGERIDNMRKYFGLSGSQMPSADQQNQYAYYEITQGQLKNVGEMLKTAQTPAEAAAIWTQYFGVPKDKTEIGRRALGAGRFSGLYTPQPAPGAPAVAGAPQTPPAGSPGVTQGDAAHPELAPGPPGSTGGAPVSLGAAVGGGTTLPVPPIPPPAVAGTPIPAGKLQSTGKPPGQAAADIIQGGVQLAQATPLLRGTGLEAGPSSAVATLATPATPQPGWGTGAATGYNVGSTGASAPPSPPAPVVTTQTPPPPAPIPVAAKADAELTWQEYRDRYGAQPTKDESSRFQITPDPKALADAENAKAAASQQLQLARSGMGDADKALAQYNVANDAVNKLRQDAQIQTANNQKDWFAKRDEILAANYRQARDQAAATALKTQEGQQAIDLAKVNAGQTWRQKLQEQAATDAQENTIKPMAAASLKAHQMNLGLEQMLPIMKDLPPGGGPVGAIVEAHPDLIPLLRFGGVLDSKETDAIRLINGLVSNISTEMKPQGLGALREYEWDAFKSQLPSLLSSPEGQQKAVAMLMNMNNRIQDEHSWMHSYFNRKIPDETNPGQMVRAHNLESDNPKESVQQRMDRELGPVIPRYSGPLSASGQAQWEQSLPPGKPYYKTWAEKDPQTGQAARRSDGSLKTHTTLEVRPWQQ